MEGSFIVHPLERPLCFLSNDIDIGYGLEEVLLLDLIFDVSVDQERVSF